MRERFVDISTADGTMKTFISHPESNGHYPAVVIFMDVWGLREELYDIARRIGTVGYYCLVPDFYHRQGEVRFDFRNERNETISFDRLDQARVQAVRAQNQKLSNAMVMEDTGNILEFLRKGEPVRGTEMGSLGYCMGGRHALCAAGTYPEHFVANASLHGTKLISERDDSPHRLAGKFRGEIYCGFGELDPATPSPLVRELSELLKPCPVQYQYAVHEGAEHGYALPDRDVYDKRAATRDWECFFGMLHRQIPPHAP